MSPVVRAQLKDGREVLVNPALGDTIDAVVTSLTAGSLSGSAVPLAGVKFATADGELVPYADVDKLVQEESFLR